MDTTPHIHDDDERQMLIGAAWRVLDRSRFENLKIERVLQEAGVSARTFYRHFPDKDALVVALLCDEMARAGRKLTKAVAEAEGPADKVAAWIRAIISAADDPRRVARARMFSSQQPLFHRGRSELDEGTALLAAPLADAIELGIQAGVFPWADVERDTSLIYALAGGKMSAALSERPEVGGGDAITDTVGFVLRALGVPPRAGGCY